MKSICTMFYFNPSFINQALNLLSSMKAWKLNPLWHFQVCFEVRKLDRFNSRFALMLHFFPLQHHYFGISHQHQPFKSDIFSLLTAIIICMPVQREHIFFCLSVYCGGGGGLSSRPCRDEVCV